MGPLTVRVPPCFTNHFVIAHSIPSGTNTMYGASSAAKAHSRARRTATPIDSDVRRARLRGMTLPVIEFRDAHISADGKYRYWLERRWGGANSFTPPIVWCMLNPSTADASIDDPTIRRVIGFSDQWGYARAIVVNLYAYRATKPRDLDGLTAYELIGPENSFWLNSYIHRANAKSLICAWGGKRFGCLPLPMSIICAPARYHLGLTAKGEPLHPLYLPKNTPLLSWGI